MRAAVDLRLRLGDRDGAVQALLPALEDLLGLDALFGGQGFEGRHQAFEFRGFHAFGMVFLFLRRCYTYNALRIKKLTANHYSKGTPPKETLNKV